MRGTSELMMACDAEPGVLANVEAVEAAIRNAVEAHGGAVQAAKRVTRDPRGGTVVVLVDLGHVAVMTSPDTGEYSIDVFMCGQVSSRGIALSLATALGGRVNEHGTHKRSSR